MCRTCVTKHSFEINRSSPVTSSPSTYHQEATTGPAPKSPSSPTRIGWIVRIRRGLFAVVPAGTGGDSFLTDPYLVASRLARDSVLSHHPALQFHGRAYTIGQQFTYQATTCCED